MAKYFDTLVESVLNEQVLQFQLKYYTSDGDQPKERFYTREGRLKYRRKEVDYMSFDSFSSAKPYGINQLNNTVDGKRVTFIWDIAGKTIRASFDRDGKKLM